MIETKQILLRGPGVFSCKNKKGDMEDFAYSDSLKMEFIREGDIKFVDADITISSKETGRTLMLTKEEFMVIRGIENDVITISIMKCNNNMRIMDMLTEINKSDVLPIYFTIYGKGIIVCNAEVRGLKVWEEEIERYHGFTEGTPLMPASGSVIMANITIKLLSEVGVNDKDCEIIQEQVKEEQKALEIIKEE